MGQRQWTEEEQRSWKTYYPAMFKAGRQSGAGFPGTPRELGVLEVTKEEREAWFEDLWARGGFNFQLANFNDVVINKEANKVVYDFWARKIRERLRDPTKQKIVSNRTISET